MTIPMPDDVAQLIIEWQHRAISCLEQASETRKATDRQRFREVAGTFIKCADELAALVGRLRAQETQFVTDDELPLPGDSASTAPRRSLI